MRARYLICYDIASPRRLRRIANLMLSYGERVQKSVFECELSPRECAKLESKASALLDAAHDSLRVYRLCPRCTRTRHLLGIGEIPQTPKTFIT